MAQCMAQRKPIAQSFLQLDHVCPLKWAFDQGDIGLLAELVQSPLELAVVLRLSDGRNAVSKGLLDVGIFSGSFGGHRLVRLLCRVIRVKDAAAIADNDFGTFVRELLASEREGAERASQQVSGGMGPDGRGR